MLLQRFFNRLLPPKIIIFADFIDPFCFIGVHNALSVAGRHKIAIEWRGFELNPETPADGYGLETAGNSDLRPGIWSSVQELARKSGLEVKSPTFISNTRRAHQLIEIANDFGVKKPLIERIYQAYFSHQKDIGNVEILMPLAESFKLPTRKVQDALAGDRYVTMIDKRREDARRRKFLGMPAFVIREKVYFGALSAEAWENIINGALMTREAPAKGEHHVR